MRMSEQILMQSVREHKDRDEEELRAVWLGTAAGVTVLLPSNVYISNPLW